MNALRELKELAGKDLISKIPVIVMQNKMDLADPVNTQEIMKVLQGEGLWFPEGHQMHPFNPVILPTVALFENEKNVYRAFGECAKLTGQMIYRSKR